MRVVELKTDLHLSTTIYDPSPHRLRPDELPVPERGLPLVFKCDECKTEVSFKLSDVEKHCSSDFTNLDEERNNIFLNYVDANNLGELSFLDFFCPTCEQAIKILFRRGPSGFWGAFFFEIEKVLALKSH
jgi:hypothetical protein